MVAILALMLEHRARHDQRRAGRPAVVLTVASAAQYFWAAREPPARRRGGAPVTAGQVVLVVAAYLGGSLPFGYWAGRLHGIDIRQHGSGNTGATNVWRVLGKRAGIPVLLLDIAKGFVPALIGLQIAGAGTAIVAGAAAVAGHTFPILLGFGGGKGVATSAGVVLAVTPVHGIALVLVFAIVSMAVPVCLAGLDGRRRAVSADLPG